METANPDFPTRLLREAKLLPAGYQETFRRVLFRVVAYLDTGAAKEATIHQWAATHREQMGKQEWLFPPGVPPEFLKDARELARLVAAIDIGKEQGSRAMLDALGTQDDPALASHVARKDGASKGGKAKADKYKQYIPNWCKWFAELKAKNTHMSDEATFEHVAKLHETTYINSDNPKEVKKVSKRTIRNHLAGD